MPEGSGGPGGVAEASARAIEPLHVGVVGATGVVGTVMLDVLCERGIPIGHLRAFASERSAGRTVRCGEHEAVVEDLATADVGGLDVALFSAGGDTSQEHAERFTLTGCIVVDNSSAFRMDPEVPLCVPEVNPHRLDLLGPGGDGHGIVANPNCSTIQLVLALKALHDAAGLRRVQVTTFQSASGTGRAAVRRLRDEAAAVLLEDDVLQPEGPHVRRVLEGASLDQAGSPYAHPLAFNVLPHCDVFDDAGNTREETKLVRETRRILGLSDLAISATCVRVPVAVGHSEAVHVELERPLEPSAAREALAAADGVRLVDDPAEDAYPMPIDAAGGDEVLVGRVRRDPTVPDGRGLAMFVVGDNLRKGAATNAVQVVEALVERGLVGSVAIG